MKGFLKSTLAAIIGTFIALFACGFLFFAMIGSIATLSESSEPAIPSKAVLKIDFNTPVTELGTEDPMGNIMSFNFSTAKPLGILKAVKAIENAATDPAIRFIYLNLTTLNLDLSHMEEVRSALVKFRTSGKPIITYGENFSLASYYLASVSDKIYMNNTGSGSIIGLGTNMMFFKDLLDKVGIDVQLIRHGKFKAAAEQYIASNISKENYDQNKEMMDSVWESMAGEICQSRGLDLNELNKLVDNLQLFSAESLKENGLVDSLVTRDEIHKILCKLYDTDDEKNIKIVSLPTYADATVKPNTKAKDKIAVIYADGEITMDGQSGLTAKEFYPIIRKVAKDSSVKAVVLRVNSPGGDAQAAEIMNQELQLLRKDKPLIVSMGAYAASGGYWISANSEKIFADNTTITGSIGVFSLSYNYGKALKKHLDINHATIGTHKHSNMMNGVDPLDSEEVTYMQGMVEDIYTQFTNLVATGRDLTVEYVDEVGQGRVWTGADAIENKLVDERGGLVDAINYAAIAAGLTDYRIAEYPAVKSSMEQFMDMLQGAEASVKAVADPHQTIKEIYSKIKEDNRPRVYARHPYVYEFNY